MDFINKLIKKGIFGLILVVSFFAFGDEINAKAAEICKINLNDGYKHLVLNTSSAWNDDGVSVYCKDESAPTADPGVLNTNISVQINNGDAIVTVNSGNGASNNYVKNAGFYQIKYFLTSNPNVNITRQVRVLPAELNNQRNIWLGENKNNTENNDEFTKIVKSANGYMAIGNFGNVGYIVEYNARGEYLWSDIIEEVNSSIKSVKLNDILNAESSYSYYVSGEYTNSSNERIAFVRPLMVNDDATGGINEMYGSRVDVSAMTTINNIKMYDDGINKHLFAVGYKEKGDATRVGVVVKYSVSGASLTEDGSYVNSITSEYNSLYVGEEKIVVVGSTSVTGYAGATDGAVLSCEIALFGQEGACSKKGPYFHLNSNLASTTTTVFKDVVSYETEGGEHRYLVVGQTRIDRTAGTSVSVNSGIEDGIVVLYNSLFEIIDVKLIGSSSSDALNSIKQAGENQFIVVGNKAANGSYNLVKVEQIEEKEEIKIEENIISGNLNVELKDVYVQHSIDEETQYIFVGRTQATTIENIIFKKGNASDYDSLLVVLDVTKFDNYQTINIEKGSYVCDGNLTSCFGNLILAKYKMKYGSKDIDFPGEFSISTDLVTTYSTYHGFTNAQGVRFIIGRTINITANPVAPNLQSNYIGIDKWYLYSRKQDVAGNVDDSIRKDLWQTYYCQIGYCPIESLNVKGAGPYYRINAKGEFIEDASGSYVELPEYKQMNNVAFQSIEKAKEFSFYQEFSRIAVVKQTYNYTTSKISSFPGETGYLSLQDYYFVYYMDTNVGNGTICETVNGALRGNCSEYTGYAFASLSRIYEIAKLIVENKNYFVSESNNRFSPNGSVGYIEEGYFAEEMTTIAYIKNASINIGERQYLEVKYYSVSGTSITGYGFGEEKIYVVAGKNAEKLTLGSGETFIENRNVAEFSDKSADFAGEGKYVARYCYNYSKANQNCGTEAAFVVDRTAPVINYSLRDTSEIENVNTTFAASKPLLLTSNADIISVADIDPYAYTVVDGKKYYLVCNVDVDSKACDDDYKAYVLREFIYEKENIDRIHQIQVFDRAGNSIMVNLKVGTVMPTVEVEPGIDDESFNLRITFDGRNKIDSIVVKYTKSEVCESKVCANALTIQEKLFNYVKAVAYNNELERIKAENDETYNANIQEYIDVLFVFSRLNQTDGSISGGASIPVVTYDEETGVYTISEETETLSVSKGLYTFTIVDSFYNKNDGYGGIGLGKTEIYAYINTEDDLDISEIENKMPSTEENAGENFFLAQTPSVYGYEVPDYLQNGFNSSMYFTDKYVYIKFKESEFGILQISTASTINEVGNFVISINNATTTRLSCVATFYGDEIGKLVTSGDLSFTGCKYGAVSFDSASTMTSNLNSEGIYFVGYLNGYYYMAFTKEGTYSVKSEIYTKVEIGDVSDEIALSASIAFSIDKTTPVIEFEVCDDKGKNCLPESSTTYTKDDFTNLNGSVVNIGKKSLKLKIDSDVFKFVQIVDDEPVTLTNRNKLLIVSIGSTKYNAYDYSINDQDSNKSGDYILFKNTGTHTVTFIDACGNEITFKFTIDGEAPVIEEIRDVDNKNFLQYNQFVNVKITIKENSFLDKEDISLLTIDYKIGKTGELKQITLKNEDGECVVSAGTGYINPGYICEVDQSGGFKFTFVLTINNTPGEKRISGSQMLYMNITDYFGNTNLTEEHEEGYVPIQEFNFDNDAPYIYYEDSYVPVTNFGPSISNEELLKMISTAADASLGNFSCDSETLISDMVICKDTPEKSGFSNDVSVKAYEAYRMAYHNYYINENGNYDVKENGEYVDVNLQLYREAYYAFSSKASLEAAINGGATIYKEGNIVPVYLNEYINPNNKYYYYYTDGLGATQLGEVSISDMYTNASSYQYTNFAACNDDKKCQLYIMYKETGTFTNISGFYENDEKGFSEVTGTINTALYTEYYYKDEGKYMADDGVYLPALTLENSCVVVTTATSTNCMHVEPNRIKLKDVTGVTYTYYNVINKAKENSSVRVKLITYYNKDGELVENSYGVIDNGMWQIARDENGEVEFGFTLASNLGRPIIFRAIDGAGNTGTNQLEMAIAIKDTIAPGVINVHSFEMDSNLAAKTKNNYIKTLKTYKVGHDTIETVIFAPVLDDQDKDPNETYYKAINLGNNYLTPNDLMITFNEPIYKVECTYYHYDANNDVGEEKNCTFNGAEFNYRENITSFSLIYDGVGESNYYLNYNITVYDFSGNSKTVNKLFVDRENPTIDFNEHGKVEERIEADYSSDGSGDSRYDSNYMITDFKNEIYVVDRINNRINAIGATNITNIMSYEVTYWKYDYSITYNNYLNTGGVFTPEENGKPKNPSLTYYILVKMPDTYPGYVIKGNSGVNSEGEACEAGDYCYVEDAYSYYPSLLDSRYNGVYWKQITEGQTIKNDEIGVYKIEYKTTDQSGNISETIIRTIYITDSQKPVLQVNGNVTTEKYGYHKEVTIKFEDEKQAVLYTYTCKSEFQFTCDLPNQLFIEESPQLAVDVFNSTGTIEADIDGPGIFKIYFVDLGDYVESSACSSATKCEDKVMTLQYNYAEYQFVIDMTPPSFDIVAKVDENNKLYYEASLTKEEYLYCAVGGRYDTNVSFREPKNLCEEYLTGTPVIEIKGNGDVVYKVYNDKNEEIYAKTYEKMATTAPKYFYNTYYHKEGDTFVEYNIGEAYNHENVYIITSITATFREDGKYLLQAMDRAGNINGRNGVTEDSSSFTIDNTAPTYNQSQTAPTGVNYWYSVPKEVISTLTVNNVATISKNTGSNYYDIFSSNLNTSFFYAFATKAEAIEYLSTIYSKHIEAQADKNCTISGAPGFYYSFYDPETKTMTSKCFLGTNGTENKIEAYDYVSSIFDKLTYPTFSANTFFGDANIAQKACDETVSDDCKNNKDMYKYVYLKTVGNTTTIEETCDETLENCIKINVKIIRFSGANNTYASFSLGSDNLKEADAFSVTVYSKTIGGSTSQSAPYESSKQIALNKNTYYIFEEKDTTISYTNYYNVKETIDHYNTTYYGIFVDNTDYLNLYSEDDSGLHDLPIQEGNGDAATNDNIYNIIIKNTGTSTFKNDYEIHELKDGNGKVIEVYSYLRLSMSINGGSEIYYNINDYLKLDENTGEYYFSIPVINVAADMKERLAKIYLTDRCGNRTMITISHSKTPPVITTIFEGEGASQTVLLEIKDNALTQIDKASVKVMFSEDGSNYKEDKTGKIRASLLCSSGQTGLDYGCLNETSINGVTRYSVRISNLENLYGFFKVEASDGHGNSSELEFIYNPYDITAEYTTTNIKYISESMDEGNHRMITKDEVKITWNNERNYLILYKVEEDGSLVEVCNSLYIGTGSKPCKEGVLDNKVVAITEDNQYVRSELTYVDIGIYEARIYNRASITINNKCVEDGNTVEDCKSIKSYTNNVCSWETNEEYCSKGWQIVSATLSKTYNNELYTRFEIDKVAPSYDVDDFSVILTTGTVNFINGNTYQNAMVEVRWEEPLIQMVYTCTYLNPLKTEPCRGNATGFSASVKEATLNVTDKEGKRFEFWFEDYAGNSTEVKLNVTIEVVLPEFEVRKVTTDGQGNKVVGNTVSNGEKINSDVKLICFDYLGSQIECDRIYVVKLYTEANSGSQLVSRPDIINISEKDGNDVKYKYVVTIKRISDGEEYPGLSKEISFRIDKKAPTITVNGTINNELKIYTGNVSVGVTDGKGQIYAGCKIVSYESENIEYSCDETPLVEDVDAYTLSKSGIYKIVATDDIGNTTTGDQIKYVRIDNDAPEISVTAKGQYLDYAVSENGYTNANEVVVEATDNSEGVYFKYRKKDESGRYGEWQTAKNIESLKEEGFYEVMPVDVVGNEGLERHFIIYRQKPEFVVYVKNKPHTTGDIIKEDALVTWEEPQSDLQAPIIKVTLNGMPYKKRDLIKETGEYLFVFTDLAGNTSTHKITINKNEKICLDNVSMIPNKQYLLDINNFKLSGNEGYKFKKDDVLVFATPTNFYNGGEGCGIGIFSYKTIDKKEYILLNENTAKYLNENTNVEITISEKFKNQVNELGGFVYVFVVDKDVAKNDLGYKIGENFFTKDPIGWCLIFVAGVGAIYLSFKIFILRKKVKVLK